MNRPQVFIEKCPFCGMTPKRMRDSKRKLLYCKYVDCPIFGVMITLPDWNRRHYIQQKRLTKASLPEERIEAFRQLLQRESAEEKEYGKLTNLYMQFGKTFGVEV